VRELDPIYNSVELELKPTPASPLPCFQELVRFALEQGMEAQVPFVSGQDHVLYVINLVQSWREMFAQRPKDEKVVENINIGEDSD
jgi:hypothetical protein